MFRCERFWSVSLVFGKWHSLNSIQSSMYRRYRLNFSCWHISCHVACVAAWPSLLPLPAAAPGALCRRGGHVEGLDRQFQEISSESVCRLVFFIGSDVESLHFDGRDWFVVHSSCALQFGFAYIPHCFGADSASIATCRLGWFWHGRTYWSRWSWRCFQESMETWLAIDQEGFSRPRNTVCI